MSKSTNAEPTRIGRANLTDAIEGAVALLAGAFIVVLACYQLGFMQEPIFGYGALADAALVAVLALIGTAVFAVILGMFLVTYLRWRHGHQIMLLRGDEE